MLLKTTEFTEEEIILEKFRVSCWRCVGRQLIDAQIDLAVDEVTRDLSVKINGYIWAEKIKEVLFKRPTSWWQMLKEEKAPAWFLRRWPVQYDTVTIDVLATYPNLRPSLWDEPYRIRRVVR